MLEIKKFIFIMGLFFLSCTSQNIFEGKITDIQSIDLNGIRSVEIIILENRFNKNEFYVDNNNRLENINIHFTYSHIRSHMLEGEKVEIVYEIKNSKKMIKDFRFLEHTHYLLCNLLNSRIISFDST